MKFKKSTMLEMLNTMFSSPKTEVRVLPSEKIHASYCIDGYSHFSMTLRYTDLNMSPKKLVMKNEHITNMMREHFLSLWKMAKEVDRNWINVLNKAVK